MKNVCLQHHADTGLFLVSIRENEYRTRQLTGEALRRVPNVSVEALSPERRGRFLIDVARAHRQRRDTAGAVAAVKAALELTPEQVRYHPMVRELVRDLVRRGRRRPNPELLTVARAVGVA